MTNSEKLKELAMELLAKENRPMRSSEVAQKLNITQQKASAILLTLYKENKLHRKVDGCKVKYGTHDFNLIEDEIQCYKFYSDYPYIVVTSWDSKKRIAEKGFKDLTIAIIYANIMSLKNKDQYEVIDNRRNM